MPLLSNPIWRLMLAVLFIPYIFLCFWPFLTCRNLQGGLWVKGECSRQRRFYKNCEAERMYQGTMTLRIHQILLSNLQMFFYENQGGSCHLSKTWRSMTPNLGCQIIDSIESNPKIKLKLTTGVLGVVKISAFWNVWQVKDIWPLIEPWFKSWNKPFAKIASAIRSCS